MGGNGSDGNGKVVVEDTVSSSIDGDSKAVDGGGKVVVDGMILDSDCKVGSSGW